jgi:hypothetical protein
VSSSVTTAGAGRRRSRQWLSRVPRWFWWWTVLFESYWRSPSWPCDLIGLPVVPWPQTRIVRKVSTGGESACISRVKRRGHLFWQCWFAPDHILLNYITLQIARMNSCPFHASTAQCTSLYPRHSLSPSPGMAPFHAGTAQCTSLTPDIPCHPAQAWHLSTLARPSAPPFTPDIPCHSAQAWQTLARSCHVNSISHLATPAFSFIWKGVIHSVISEYLLISRFSVIAI